MSQAKLRHKWSLNFLSRQRPAGLMAGALEYADDTLEGEVVDLSLLTKQGWSTALGPWKAMPMNLLMMFMMGNSIGLFPIMMLGMMVYRPVQALLSYKEAFQRLSGDQGLLQKFVYVSANIVVLALATWKLRSMGLLPTAQSDWVEFIEARQVLNDQYRHAWIVARVVGAVLWESLLQIILQHTP